jgi:hypothetical protein
MKLSILLLLFFGIIINCPGLGQKVIPYLVPSEQWDEELGNHRAIIKGEKPSDSVSVYFLWRRHDSSPRNRQMLIINTESRGKLKIYSGLKCKRKN